ARKIDVFGIALEGTCMLSRWRMDVCLRYNLSWPRLEHDNHRFIGSGAVTDARMGEEKQVAAFCLISRLAARVECPDHFDAKIGLVHSHHLQELSSGTRRAHRHPRCLLGNHSRSRLLFGRTAARLRSCRPD